MGILQTLRLPRGRDVSTTGPRCRHNFHFEIVHGHPDPLPEPFTLTDPQLWGLREYDSNKPTLLLTEYYLVLQYLVQSPRNSLVSLSLKHF